MRILLPMGRSGTRRTTVEENDARVLDAVVKVLDRFGVDGLTARRVADAAGFTTGAVYGRFENTDEMMVEVWLRRLRPFVRAGLWRSIDMAEGSPEAERLEIPQEYDAVAERLGAFFIAVSPRNEVLAEVVLPEVDQWFHELGLGPECPMAQRAHRSVAIAAYIGAMLSGAIDDRLAPDWVRCLRWWEASRRLPSRISEAAVPTSLPLHADVVDDELGALLGATADVIAHAGVSKTTITRIARRAGLPRSALYTYFDSRDELIAAAVTYSAWGTASDSRRTIVSSGPHSLAHAAHMYLDPANRWFRRRRVEFYLAGVSDARIAQAVVERERSLIDSVLGEQRLRSPMAREAMADVLRFVGILATGAFLLPETSRVFAGIDWRFGLSPLMGAALSEIADLERDASSGLDSAAS